MTSPLPQQSSRVCRHDPTMTTCWWVVSGNPHIADGGHGCACLHDPKDWVPMAEAAGYVAAQKTLKETR